MGNSYGITTYAAEICQSERPSKETGIFRSVESLRKLLDCPTDIKTSWDMVCKTQSRFPKHNALGTRKHDAMGVPGDYEWTSYTEMRESAEKVGSYLIQNNLCPVNTYEKEMDTELAKSMRVLGVFMPNRPEWFITEYGCASQNICLVPLYDTLGEESMNFIADLVKLSVIVISNVTFKSAISAVKASNGRIKTLIKVDAVNEEHMDEAAKCGVEIIKFSDIMATPASLPPNPSNNPDSINTLCFTSGTTGMPKGVILTHRNLVACAHATNMYGPLSKGEELEIGSEDCHMSYLPLAHVFERLVCGICIMVGASIGCYSGNMLTLMDDIPVLNPTVFVSVPRLFNRINDRISAGIDEKSLLIQSLFSWGLNSKISRFRTSASTTSTVWDTVVFGRFKGLLGKRLRLMISGGAPLDPKVHERIQACFCAPLLQGYGMSETMGPSFLCSSSDTVVGHVGGVYPTVEFKLESVPELGYSVDAEVPEGELLLRGSSIASGYFCNAEANESHFDNGWLHTGDICALLPSNGIKIIDRKKNLFKLAQGEYVAPEKVENSLGLSPYVNQIFVHGNTTESFLVAVVVVDKNKTLAWGSNHSMDDFPTICKEKEFRKEVLRNLAIIGTEGGLMGFEKPKNIVCIPDEFTVANDLLTPTSKLKRAIAQKFFENEIETMYREGVL